MQGGDEEAEEQQQRAPGAAARKEQRRRERAAQKAAQQEAQVEEARRRAELELLLLDEQGLQQQQNGPQGESFAWSVNVPCAAIARRAGWTGRVELSMWLSTCACSPPSSCILITHHKHSREACGEQYGVSPLALSWMPSCWASCAGYFEGSNACSCRACCRQAGRRCDGGGRRQGGQADTQGAAARKEGGQAGGARCCQRR